MKIKPLFDRVVLEDVKTNDNKKLGGLVLPESAQEKPLLAIVKAVGPGQENGDGKISEMQVKVGDKILYSKYAGNNYKLNEREFVIIRQSDILAIVED